MTMLSVEHLTITVGTPEDGRVLVEDVDLRLERGETLGIVGESGSGKSLTARAVMRLLPRGLGATGKIDFEGQQLLTAPDRTIRRLRGGSISLLMQDPFTMLNPLQTVWTTVVESLDPEVQRSRSRSRAEVERRLKEVALTLDVKERYPFQLSGGMRQRVALAAALGRDPSLLIADEPTTALDVTTQDEILKLLKEIQQHRGMSLILITHDLRLAFSVCDTVQVMYAGSVAERAPAAELSRRPLHPYSCGLLLSDLPVSEYVDEIKSIAGRVPPASSVSHQCAFADRCAWVMPQCLAGRPHLKPVGRGRSSACIRINEIANELQEHLAVVDGPKRVVVARPVGNPLVLVRNLRKTYTTSGLVGSRSTVLALDDVSLEVLDRESVGLVGETGSGKSTIARSILGLTRPDSGSITIDGIDASDFRKLDRREERSVRSCVQAVFQDPYASLNPAISVGSTLREVLAFRNGGRVADVEVENLLDSVGLSGSYAARRPAALSGGERQRIAIARALAMRPRVLVCDEPVASLDVSAQAQILELLRKVRQQRGMSMLFITHDLSVVRQMCERVIVLYRGKVVEQGTTEAVLDRPDHAYTQQLLSAVPEIS